MGHGTVSSAETHFSFLKFLRNIDKAVPAHRDVHLLLDNYATHKTPDVQAWLVKHPRFKLHFTPTRSRHCNRPGHGMNCSG